MLFRWAFRPEAINKCRRQYSSDTASFFCHDNFDSQPCVASPSISLKTAILSVSLYLSHSPSVPQFIIAVWCFFYCFGFVVVTRKPSDLFRFCMSWYFAWWLFSGDNLLSTTLVSSDLTVNIAPSFRLSTAKCRVSWKFFSTIVNSSHAYHIMTRINYRIIVTYYILSWVVLRCTFLYWLHIMSSILVLNVDLCTILHF